MSESDKDQDPSTWYPLRNRQHDHRGWRPLRGKIMDDAETAAGESVRLVTTLQWQLEDAPLGEEALHSFGQNGPPMNVMDACPESGKLFVANQRRLVQLSIDELSRSARAMETDGANAPRRRPTEEAASLLLPAQANRVRCGYVGRRPVVVAVDSVGGVTVAATTADAVQAVATLSNFQPTRSGARSGPGVNPNSLPMSTWGIALEHHPSSSSRAQPPAWHSDASDEDSDDPEGYVLVSANDHCVKSFALKPDGAPSRHRRGSEPPHAAHPSGGGGLRPAAGQRRWSMVDAARSLPPASMRLPDRRRVQEDPDERLADKASAMRVMLVHSSNIPSIDVADGQLLSASLDGHVCRVTLPKSRVEHGLPAATGGQHQAAPAAGGYGGQPAAASPAVPARNGYTAAAAEAPDSGLDAAALPHDMAAYVGRGPVQTAACFLPQPAEPGTGLWNVSWIPLKTIRALESEGQEPDSDGPAIEWKTAPGAPPLAHELLKAYVLPFLEAEQLLGKLQAVSVGHAALARQEVEAEHRTEHVAMCIDSTNAYLLNDDLKLIARLPLLVDVVFAHARYVPEISSILVASKFETSPRKQMAAITVWRRRRSLHFRLAASTLQTWPSKGEQPYTNHPPNLCVGMTTAPSTVSAPAGGLPPRPSDAVTGAAAGASSAADLFVLLASRHLSCHSIARDIEATGWRLGS
eukprot:TRINITY_DN73307_c0_g1_i1.p1 TRINITY_DN73307_c0_g1~~TRINITY_DN73307_c0_g1_i1.p1  ORF type:complete len:805 (-),score=150.09 TRINITY_DN73307_c0_g1_i1:282-2360(-)